MSPLLPIIGLGGLLLLMGGKKGAATSGAFGSAVQRMKDNDAVGVLNLSRDSAFDKGTQAALFDTAQRMNARMRSQPVQQLPLIAPSAAGIDIANNEFAARVMALEGNPVVLDQWAKAYAPVYPPVADAILLKAVQISVALALASGDTAVMRRVAKDLRAKGFAAQADLLEVEAKRREVLPPQPSNLPATVPVAIPGIGTVAVPSPVIGPQTLPTGGTVTVTPPPQIPITVPSNVPVTASPGVDQKRVRAENLATHLRSVKRYREDREMVRFYQQDNGLKADGMYGVATALSLATRFNIIPPLPFYFSKKTAATDKKKYKSALAQVATADPDQSDARQSAWLAAMKVDAQ